MMRTVRIISQSLFFFLFVLLLFVFNTKQWAHIIPTELFLQINPLVFLLTSFASKTIIFVLLPGALVIALLSIFTGRTFCGFICPLGAAIDFSDMYVTKKARTVASRPHITLQKLKYIFLFIFTCLAFLGVLSPLFLDPISIFTRIMASIADPAVRIVTLIAQNIQLWISNFFTNDQKELIALNIAIPGAFSALILFVLIFAGGLFDRRFWCQYVCPTGAFLGLLGRFSFLRRHVDTHNCNNCKACSTRQCPTRAIHHENTKQTSTAECILCGACAENRRGCTTISFVKPSTNENVPLNFTRRSVLGGLVAGILLPPVIKGSVISDKRVEPVRPPGSIPEEQFLSRCLGCGECIKACPDHALQPSGFTYGFMLLNTPRLTPSIGYCQPGCTVCTNVCPSIAIRPVPVADKPYIKMGTAIVLKDHCYAWRGEISCMVCMQKCPYKAITEQSIELGSNTISGPLVNKDLCTGCGACEKNCANKAYSSIRVFNYGERRIESGPFISDKKKMKIDSARNERFQSSEKE